MTPIKALRIFLLVLIILGIFALATQKIWVPKLVDKIISSESSPTVVIPEADRECYAYNHKATVDAPYTVNEFIDMTVARGRTVTGTKTGTQAGPDMTNGYSGTLAGAWTSNTLDVTFSYTVEGSSNKEEEIYRGAQGGIEKLRYPLIERGGILVPDKTKEYTAILYREVDCTSSDIIIL